MMQEKCLFWNVILEYPLLFALALPGWDHPATYLIFDCDSVVLGRAGEIVSQKVVDKTKIFDAQVSNIRVPRNVPAEGSLERG